MKVNVHIDSVQKMLKRRGLEKNGQVQKIIDSEVLRLSDKYTPMLTGALKKSGTIHTKIGSGLVRWHTPYARKQYYNNAGRGKQGTAKGGLRGKYWFARMKADHLRDIVKKVKAKFDR